MDSETDRDRHTDQNSNPGSAGLAHVHQANGVSLSAVLRFPILSIFGKGVLVKDTCLG